MGKVARRDGMGWGNEDVGETAGEGGGTPPPSLFFSFPKPTRRCENHTPPHLSLIIPPERWGGFFSPAATPMEWRGTHPLLHFECLTV